MKQSPQNGSSVRGFTNFFDQLFVEEIMAYGCWCFLDPANDYRKNARGQPIDEIDRTCRNLINGYKCATMDAEANGEEACDAQTVDYVKFDIFNGLIENLEADCISLNPDSVCAQRACQIEMVFMYPIIEDGLQNVDQNLVHVSAGGTFDPETICDGLFNPVKSETECCGQYSEIRHPFRLTHSDFTTRSCCSNTVIKGSC